MSTMGPSSQLQALRDEINTLKSELQRKDDRKGALVSADSLDAANREIGLLQAEVERLKLTMKGMVSRGDLDRLQQELDKARLELTRQKAQQGETVPLKIYEAANSEIAALRAELEKAKKQSEAKVDRGELDKLNQELNKLAEELRKSKSLLWGREKEVEDLKQQMNAMVAGTKLMEVLAAAKASASELAALKVEKASLEEAKDGWKAKAEDYKRQLDELLNKMTDMVDRSEYYKALVAAKGSKDDLASHKYANSPR
jgi:chromosome segregation ATPase